MVDFDQGPGQNIDFYLITSGIDLDPDHGYFTREVYNNLKTVIIQRAELFYESPTIREIHDQNVNTFLEAYPIGDRTVYQFLFGVVQYSNAWTIEKLTQAITDAPLFSILRPSNNTFSIDFINSQTQGFKLFENRNISGSDFWVEKKEFT